MHAHSLVRVCALLVLIVASGPADAARAQHLRLRTDHGPVHTWRPANYDASTAGIVIYVHGFFVNVDEAWREHRLARQFGASGLNALFIACEGPRNGRDRVSWSSLAALLDTVENGIGSELPQGRIVVVGHSGAHRTVSLWLDQDHIDTIVLLDALYGKVDEFRAWVEADEGRRLFDASVLTRRWTDELHAELPETLVFDRFPPSSARRLRGARDARVVYVRSQHDHMALVTGGVALPMLLRAVNVPSAGSTH